MISVKKNSDCNHTKDIPEDTLREVKYNHRDLLITHYIWKKKNFSMDDLHMINYWLAYERFIINSWENINFFQSPDGAYK